MEIKITGLDRAINNLTTFHNQLPHLAYNGMRESAELLMTKITEVDPEYAETAEIKEYPGARRLTITIGPRITIPVLEYLSGREQYMQIVCPYWKYLSEEALKLVPSSTELSNIVNSNINEIRNIIIKNIKLGIRW